MECHVSVLYLWHCKTLTEPSYLQRSKTLFLNVYSGPSVGVHLFIGQYEALYETPTSNTLIRIGRRKIVFFKNENRSQTLKFNLLEHDIKILFPLFVVRDIQLQALVAKKITMLQIKK